MWLLRLNVIALLIVMAGCTSRPAAVSSSPADYRTVAETPDRNSSAATQENARAIELIERGKLDEAEEALKRALAADIMFGPAHNNLGKVYFQQKKYYLAAWEFQYAAKLMPNRPEPLNNLGLVFESVGRLDDAVTNYAKAVSSEPDNAEFIGNAARARLRRGDKDDEVKALLNDLVMKDTRPDWINWARERLAMLKATRAE